MPIAVVPTLAFMAQVYRLSPDGGVDSERFRAYSEAAAHRVPVSGYNPMTSKPVPDTIAALLNIDAEALLEATSNEAARHIGYDRDDLMSLTVAAPGMWTDRLGTEVEHRLCGRFSDQVLWWYDETVDPDAIRAAGTSQTVRLALQREGGPPASLASAVYQEGLAGAMAGQTGSIDATAAEALDVLADDASLATMVAFLYGDDVARALGFTPLGLGDRVGYRHAIAVAAGDPSRRLPR